MIRLAGALRREYEDDETYQIDVHTPANITYVNLHFKGEKVAKVLGSLAKARFAFSSANKDQRMSLSGILVKKNFAYHIVAPPELRAYTELSTTVLTQIIHIPFNSSASQLQYDLLTLTGNINVVSQSKDSATFCLFNDIYVIWRPKVVCIKVSSTLLFLNF